MAESERTRSRERERPTQSAYEVAVTYDKERTERQTVGRVVLRLEDCPQEQTRQGLLRPYLDPFLIPDTPLQHWAVFTHELHTKSGKHRHQGGLVIYVIDGEGYSIVDGERFDWKSGDLLLLPIRPGGVEHQHYNLKADRPCRWIAFCHMPTMDNLAMEMTQIEVSPDFRG